MTGLRVFEAVVRNGSLSAAARELYVTPAAISHRLRSLEAQAGRPLVYRSGGRFHATPLGREIVATLDDAFEKIRQADAVLRMEHATRLHISVAYSFATLWLGPRLMTFAADHPDLDAHLQPSHDPGAERGADLIIVHSDRCPDGPGWQVLFEDTCAVMGRPDHPALRPGAAGFASLDNARLIHVAHSEGPSAGEFSWRDWYAAKNLVRRPALQRGTHVSAEHLALEMILRGDTLALISLVNASDHIGEARVAVMPDSAVKSNRCYWIRVSGKTDTRDAARAFETWLRDQLSGVVPA